MNLSDIGWFSNIEVNVLFWILKIGRKTFLLLSYIYALSSFLTQKGNGTRFYTLEHLKGHSRDFHLNFSSMYLFLVVKKMFRCIKINSRYCRQLPIVNNFFRSIVFNTFWSISSLSTLRANRGSLRPFLVLSAPITKCCFTILYECLHRICCYAEHNT